MLTQGHTQGGFSGPDPSPTLIFLHTQRFNSKKYNNSI
jgi:hypothetical protein